MLVDRETFTEIALNLKLASDGILKTARCLARISDAEDFAQHQGYEGAVDYWQEALDGLVTMNTAVTTMERLLHALLEANKEEAPPEPSLC